MDEKLIQEKRKRIKYARRGVHTWVESYLGKPKVCWECGIADKKYYDWANISGKYKRDLKDWRRLCRKCHAAFDNAKYVRGENHGRAKLTEKDVLQIRSLYIPKIFGYGTALAREFNVSYHTMICIVKRKTWKHI